MMRDSEQDETPDQAEPLCVSVEEAARLLGIGRKLAYQLVAEGRIPSIRLGGRRVVPLARLRKFVLTAR